MSRLLQLLIRNGGFLTFVLVEAFCFYIIVQFNTRQKAVFNHSAGIWGGSMLEKRQEALDYFGLKNRVDSLLRENALLQADVANARIVRVPYRDTFFTVLYDTISRTDSIRRRMVRPAYGYIYGQAIGNSINNTNNWLMVNRGSNDKVIQNMGVVTRNGIVGIVRHVDNNFSMVMSVLHRQSRISVALKKQKAFGSLIWEGGDPEEMEMKFIPRHFKVAVGDTIVTSGLSNMFPKGITVGFVTEDPKQDPENPYFWILKIRPSQDMSTVEDVYIVNNLFHSQLDSLQQKVKEDEQ